MRGCNLDLSDPEVFAAEVLTYTQAYIQIVFAVQGRQNLICPERKEELQKYMTGIVTGQGQKLIAIHCMPDHTHVWIGLKPNIALSNLVGDIKSGLNTHPRHRLPTAALVKENCFDVQKFFFHHSEIRFRLLL